MLATDWLIRVSAGEANSLVVDWCVYSWCLMLPPAVAICCCRLATCYGLMLTSDRRMLPSDLRMLLSESKMLLPSKSAANEWVNDDASASLNASNNVVSPVLDNIFSDRCFRPVVCRVRWDRDVCAEWATYRLCQWVSDRCFCQASQSAAAEWVNDEASASSNASNNLLVPVVVSHVLNTVFSETVISEWCCKATDASNWLL